MREAARGSVSRARALEVIRGRLYEHLGGPPDANKTPHSPTHPRTHAQDLLGTAAYLGLAVFVVSNALGSCTWRIQLPIVRCVQARRDARAALLAELVCPSAGVAPNGVGWGRAGWGQLRVSELLVSELWLCELWLCELLVRRGRVAHLSGLGGAWSVGLRWSFVLVSSGPRVLWLSTSWDRLGPHGVSRDWRNERARRGCEGSCGPRCEVGPMGPEGACAASGVPPTQRAPAMPSTSNSHDTRASPRKFCGIQV